MPHAGGAFTSPDSRFCLSQIIGKLNKSTYTTASSSGLEKRTCHHDEVQAGGILTAGGLLLLIFVIWAPMFPGSGMDMVFVETHQPPPGSSKGDVFCLVILAGRFVQ